MLVNTMNRETIYIVITVMSTLHRKLADLFSAELLKYPDLEVAIGPIPEGSPFYNSPATVAEVQYVLSEHMLISSFQLDPNAEAAPARIRPGIHEVMSFKDVQVAVIGSPHYGKTAIINVIDNALHGAGVPREAITRISLDHPHEDYRPDAAGLGEHIANMQARKVQILFQIPRLSSSVDELMARCTGI